MQGKTGRGPFFSYFKILILALIFLLFLCLCLYNLQTRKRFEWIYLFRWKLLAIIAKMQFKMECLTAFWTHHCPTLTYSNLFSNYFRGVEYTTNWCVPWPTSRLCVYLTKEIESHTLGSTFQVTGFDSFGSTALKITRNV